MDKKKRKERMYRSQISYS